MKRLAILIPAHNEEVVIGNTLSTLSEFMNKSDIYVVSDGSKDKTSQVAKKYTRNVFETDKNVGKAKALNLAIDKFKLPDKYEYLMPLDADSQISKKFINKMLMRFDEDKKWSLINKKDDAICVVGRVMSRKHNWISDYRMWEYEVAQTIHKKAQSLVNSILVCPGCSTIYRASLFKKTKIPTGTLAEDMDLTFLIYRKNLGRIIFLNSAEVLTQDPKNTKDLIKQLERWYTGFWQCVRKHNIPWGGQMLDAEVTLLATEGLFGGLVVLILIFGVPFALNIKPEILIAPIIFDFVLFVLPTLLFTAVRNKSLSLFRHLPHFYFMRILSSLIFLKSFLKVVLAFDLNAIWNKATRYSVT